MLAYKYEGKLICYHCYIAACDDCEEQGYAEEFNTEKDDFYYPIAVDIPSNSPIMCEGSYCKNYLDVDPYN